MKHVILAENKINEYTLIVRVHEDTDSKLDCCPFVVCWRYKDGTWAQGHYFSELESAILFMHFKSAAEEIYKVIQDMKEAPFD